MLLVPCLVLCADTSPTLQSVRPLSLLLSNVLHFLFPFFFFFFFFFLFLFCNCFLTSLQTKDRTYQNAVLLNNSPPTKALRNKNNNSAASAESQKYFVYDTLLEHSRFRVGQFMFSRELPPGASSALAAIGEKPRKVSNSWVVHFFFLFFSLLCLQVMLSPNKQLLLILGAYRDNRKNLVVFQIFETYPDPFHLIFYDMAFTYVDVCFRFGS